VFPSLRRSSSCVDAAWLGRMEASEGEGGGRVWLIVSALLVPLSLFDQVSGLQKQKLRARPGNIASSLARVDGAPLAAPPVSAPVTASHHESESSIARTERVALTTTTSLSLPRTPRSSCMLSNHYSWCYLQSRTKCFIVVLVKPMAIAIAFVIFISLMKVLLCSSCRPLIGSIWTFGRLRPMESRSMPIGLICQVVVL
jgi:hypothetical protein